MYLFVYAFFILKICQSQWLGTENQLLRYFHPFHLQNCNCLCNVWITVTIRMFYGDYNFISALDYPLLIFYGIMGLVYIIYGLIWLVLLACNWRDLLRVQFWIGGVILLGKQDWLIGQSVWCSTVLLLLSKLTALESVVIEWEAVALQSTLEFCCPFTTKSHAKGSNCVHWSRCTTLKINNKHQTKVSAHFIFFPVCEQSVLVYPTGFDFFH